MTMIHRCQGDTDHGEQCPATTTDPVRIGTWRCSKHTETTGAHPSWTRADLGEAPAYQMHLQLAEKQLHLPQKPNRRCHLVSHFLWHE